MDLRFQLYGEVCSSGQAECTAINFGLQWKVRQHHSHGTGNYIQYFHAYFSVSNKHFKYSTDVTAPLSAVECLSLFTVQVLASVAGPIFNERLHLHLCFLARPRGRSLDVCPSLSSLSAAHLLVLQSEPSQYLQPAAASSSHPSAASKHVPIHQSQLVVTSKQCLQRGTTDSSSCHASSRGNGVNTV